MKNIIRLSSLIALLFLGACEGLDLNDKLDNPNEVNVSEADNNLLMNKILLEFSDFVAEVNTPTMELSRMKAMTGGDTYPQAYTSQDFNDIWRRGYRDVLVQIETLLANTDGTGLSVHSGVGRILKAYTYVTLVDIFGDVPFSEASKGNLQIFNPKADPGKDIYTECFKILDEAIVLLDKTPSVGLTRDIYYGSDRTKWTALANTLKLKMYLNLRLTDAATAKTKIEELLTKDLIDTQAEEFTYKYGTADVPQRSRHPLYRTMYAPQAGAAGSYLSNYYMLIAYKQKGVEDPRWRYYFYRQVGSIAKALADEPKSLPCIRAPRPDHYTENTVWCAFEPGFFGRDHGNGDGAPPDNKFKTTYGVYPAGGLVDNNLNNAEFSKVTQQGMGGNGAGIEPIMMASFTTFMKAEAALILKTSGDPKALLQDAVQTSIKRVQDFGAQLKQTTAYAASTTDYLTAVDNLYTAATTTDEKLDVISKEYYLALWGNGIEAYNLYRRTGKPGDMQLPRTLPSGDFYRTLLYPAEFVNLNSTAKQKSTNLTKVFWDNNPDNFIK